MSDMNLLLISIHGLIRGHDLELGRDADTGGQTKYVVELARALAQLENIGSVELLTRLVEDPRLSSDYARSPEQLGAGASILRIPAGPPGYIRKEALWDYLDPFADNTLDYIRESGRKPELIHSHYADAGYVASRLAHRLGIPLVHTGHSLGRVKRGRLLAAGLSADQIERQFNMARRIEAEETTLAGAERVITSTYQEIEEQYELYDHYRPEQMCVIPPGTDLDQFRPAEGGEWNSPIADELRKFLHEPHRPIILALSRPDRRKNNSTLVSAYGEAPDLQQIANLVIVAGTRDDITEMEEGARDVLTDLLLLIDRYDLYGKIAYPKSHSSEEIPLLYRLAASSGGVFVNPALTEPFGLTLLEAAASGLPVVATEEGGPRDIVANCRNGVLVDPLNGREMAQKILDVLTDKDTWLRLAGNGLEGVSRHYSWEAHAQRYSEMVRPIIERTEVLPRTPVTRRPQLHRDRAIFSDLDQNLLGAPSCLPDFLRTLRQNRSRATFGIATGRRLDSALKAIKKYGIPEPDVLITSGGTEIYYAPDLTADAAWAQHIDHRWTPSEVRRVLSDLPGLNLQSRGQQNRFKISYFIDPREAPSPEEITSLLHREEQAVNIIFSFGQFFDILPIRASKGYALRYFADRWDIPLQRILVAGGSGADEDMMRGNTLAVVVANRHHEELSQLVDTEHIYFASQSHALGILEAIDYYDFFGACAAPESDTPTTAS